MSELLKCSAAAIKPLSNLSLSPHCAGQLPGEADNEGSTHTHIKVFSVSCRPALMEGHEQAGHQSVCHELMHEVSHLNMRGSPSKFHSQTQASKRQTRLFEVLVSLMRYQSPSHFSIKVFQTVQTFCPAESCG